MRRIVLALTLALFFASRLASAYAQDCSPDRTGFVMCSSGGLSLNGYVDRTGYFDGTIRGTDSYGNSYRGSVTGPTDNLRGTTTITPGMGSGAVTVTTSCFLGYCTTR